jgi:hypothetical protein
MGIQVGLRGDSERASLRKEHAVWAPLLGTGEQVQAVHRAGRTTFLFTNRRLVLVEEGMTGRQVDYTSVPYRAITHFAVEAGGPFAADADLRLWIAGRANPVEKPFSPGSDVYAVQALLAQYAAGG